MKLTDKDTVVLADFDNSTGDEVFDGALKQALAVQLGQSPFLNILSDRKVEETLGMMGRPSNGRVTRNVAREVCLRTGSKAIVLGSISKLGGRYVIGLDAVDCSDGDTLAKEQEGNEGAPASHSFAHCASTSHPCVIGVTVKPLVFRDAYSPVADNARRDNASSLVVATHPQCANPGSPKTRRAV